MNGQEWKIVKWMWMLQNMWECAILKVKVQLRIISVKAKEWKRERERERERERQIESEIQFALPKRLSGNIEKKRKKIELGACN